MSLSDGQLVDDEHEEHLVEAAVVDARALMLKLGAPDRLRRHGELVAEAANELALEVSGLGLRVTDRVASRLSKEHFDLFYQLDTLFEQIGAHGHDNLERSLEAPSF